MYFNSKNFSHYLILFIFCYSSLFVYYFYTNKDKMIHLTNYNVYILDIIVSERNLTRFQTAEKSWIKKLNKESTSIIFKVASSTQRITNYENILYYVERKINPAFSFIYPFIYAMKDFISNTDFRWFFRTTDDVFINIELFDKLIQDYEHDYDPLNDFVIKGSVVSNYIHGGSGWIMSRYAVQRYLTFLEKYPISYEKAGDDVIFTNHIQQIFVRNLSNINDKHFIGTKLSKKSINMLQNDINTKKLSKIEKCNNSIQNIYKMDEIVVWHSGEKTMAIVEKAPYLNQIFQNISHLIFLETNSNGSLDFCIKNK